MADRLDPYLPHRRELLPAARVRELSRLRPAVPVRDALLCWLWIVAAWTAVALWPAWWVVLLAVPVIGNRFYALFLIGHDGFHRRVFDSTPRNDLFCDVAVYAPIGAITRINKRNHLAHHVHLGSGDDPDRHKHACFHLSTRAALVGYLTGVTSVVKSISAVFLRARRAKGRPPGVRDAGRGEEGGYGVRDLLILGAWQLLLVGGLTGLVGWWAYPALWLLPVFAFTYLADSFRAFAEHSQPEPDAQGDRHRLVTFLPGWHERLLFAPLNMNYHAVHHLWPSIPYYNLATADREMRAHPAAGDASALETRPSYLGYLARYLGSLPLPECRGERV